MSVFRANNSPVADWTVPRPRTPHPMDTQFPLDESPTERLFRPSDEEDEQKEREERHWGVVAAVAMSAVALVIALSASVAAARAAGRTEDHVTATPAPTASASALPYVKVPLGVRVACGASAAIDLDRPPRLGPPDLRFDNRCGSTGLLVSADTGALAASHVPDRYQDRPDCAAAIGADPLEAGEGVPVQRGTVLCVATGATLALVEVTDVDRAGGASLLVTGWTVP